MGVRIVIDSTYRFSGVDEAFGGSQFYGSLLNRPTLESQAKKALSSDSLRQVSIAIDNNDGLIDTAAFELEGKTLELLIDDYPAWYGKIVNWSISETRVLSINAREKSVDVMGKIWPDEEIRLADFSDASRTAVEQTIPIVLGGSAAYPIRVPFTLVDRVNFRYLGPVGEIRSIEAVWKDGTAISTGFTAYTGTAGQAIYPGLAYIEFASDPRDGNGRWPELFADVVGLKLDGSLSEAESRNPAWVLYYLLTTARSGVCGWGLGVPVGEIDAASFAQAVADCVSLGLYIDGVISTGRAFREVVVQIESACRGKLVRENGANGDKYYFTVDKASASVKTFDAANCRPVNLGIYPDRKNRHVVYYRFDAQEGKYLASATREDTAHQTAYGEPLENKVSLELVADHTQGGIICDYMNNVEKLGVRLLVLETEEYSGLAVGSVVTVNVPDYSAELTSALYRIEKITPNGFKAMIEARKYSDDYFDTDAPASPPADPDTDPSVPGIVSSPPGEPSGLSLSTGNVTLADGTIIAYIEGTFTGGALAMYYEVEYGIVTSPQTYKSAGAFSDTKFRIDGLENAKTYAIRITPKNVGGSGTPVTGTITTSADVTAPGKPATPELSLLFKSIRVKCFQNATKASDLAGFKVFRNTTNNSGTATEIGWVACGGNDDGVVLLDEGTAYGATYYYWTKAVDRTGNASAFSDAAGPVVTSQIVAGDIGAAAIASSAMFAAGVVDGPSIAAGAITASKLYIAAPGSALNDDPGFLDASAWMCMDGYEGYNCYSLATVADGKVGNGVLRGTGCAGSSMFVGAKFIPVDPTKTYRLRAWIRKRDAGTNGSVYLSVREYNAAGATVSSNAGTYLVGPVTPTTTWTEYCALIGLCSGNVFNAATKTARVGGILDLNTNAGLGYEIQDLRLEEAIPGTLIQDGSIITAKVAANAILAGNIAAGAICAGHINAAGISADCITAGTICADRITALNGTASYGGTTLAQSFAVQGANLLPDPDFRGVPYDVQHIAGAAPRTIGEWVTEGSGALNCTYTIHKQTTTTLYKASLFPGSSGILMRSTCATDYSGFGSLNSIPVTTGTTYIVGGYLASYPGYCCPKVYFRACFLNAAGASVCSCAILDGCASLPQALTRICACFVAPATATQLKIFIYNASAAGDSYLFASGFSAEEKQSSTGTIAPWSAGESGTITANRVIAGALRSLNWGASAGSYFDLNAGTFCLGGSSAPALSWNGSTLTVNGVVCATSGCFSGTITSTAGCIGGWSIQSNYLISCTAAGCMLMYTPYLTYYSYGCLSNTYATLGYGLDCGGWWGEVTAISVAKIDRRISFSAGVTNTAAFYLPDGCGTLAAGCPYFWVGTSTSYMKWYNGLLTVSGNAVICGCIYSTTGNVGGFTLGATNLTSSGTWSSTCYTFALNCNNLNIAACCATNHTWSSGVNATGFNSTRNCCGSLAFYYNISSFGVGSSCAFAPITMCLPASTSCVTVCSYGIIYATNFGTVSDYDLKDSFEGVSILSGLRGLPFYSWRFRDARVLQVKPIAQDFFRAFPDLTDDPKGLPILDGLALKGVQELDLCITAQNACITSLESRLANIESRLNQCA